MVATLPNTRREPTHVVGGWAHLLVDEERQAQAQGFGAGIIVVGFTNELLAQRLQDRDRAEAETLAVIARHIQRTDRTAMVAPGRLGIVVVPVAGAPELTRRARELHRDLRSGGLDVDVAFSIRRRDGGLAATAARADALLDTAIDRRHRRRQN